ncbi:MAG: DNA mismatch repair protein MutS [Armatimonadota bacterium]|nr:DNA mismatch repair protein MutS [Armatimonadota bacterium]
MTRDGPLTPMMRQYQELKARYPDALLMFRLGDFYELFFEDARVAARELEIVLTSREAGKGRRVPMCGVPYHAVNSYLARLVERGYRVAICDQVEDPKKARGLVRREVTRVVTPGTVMDASLLPGREHRYLVAVHRTGEAWGLAAADLTTGDFLATQGDGGDALPRIAEEIARFEPREVLVAQANAPTLAAALGHVRLTTVEEWWFEPSAARRTLLQQFRVATLDGFGAEGLPLAVGAAGALLAYLHETQLSALAHLRRLRVYSIDACLQLDETTRRNLELVRNARDSGRGGTILEVLDDTVTAMGSRLLRDWLLRPLVDVTAIRARQRAVAAARAHRAQRQGVRDTLKAFPDLPRLVGRVGHGSATPKDLAALRACLERLPAARVGLAAIPDERFADLAGRVDAQPELATLLARALVADPPLSARDGGLIRPGYDAELDHLRAGAAEGKAWIAGLEAAERARTGIKSLKVGFNKVFGYYIEVSNANRHLVPADYLRRQTLTGAERYVTLELRAREAQILGAEERTRDREYELFVALRDAVAARAEALLATAAALAEADALLSLAEVAERYGYVRPDVVEEPVLEIRGGRHPVVERLLEGERFVPNDLVLRVEDRAILIVTGPNMAGKSTLLRQAALITIMAQMGACVPAASARVGIADRIFTRVGAIDDLAAGRSTFLVEMQEVTRILLGATRHSLIILDEVGRGTSTYDGMSLAWAVVGYLHDRIGARTLFATHFHELTELADLLPRVHNVAMRVREEGDRIVFLHEVTDGRADRSYGIHVAQLAGMPEEVLDEARRILRQLEAAAARPREPDAPPLPARARRARQLPLALELPSPLEDELLALPVEGMTPLQALQTLAELRERVRRQREASRTARERRLQ